jgi:hypothetical protein
MTVQQKSAGPNRTAGKTRIAETWARKKGRLNKQAAQV